MRISDWTDVCSSDLSGNFRNTQPSAQFVCRNLCSPGRQNPSNQSRATSIPITRNAAIMSLALMLRGPSNGRPSIVRDGEERRCPPASKSENGRALTRVRGGTDVDVWVVVGTITKKKIKTHK